MSKRLACALCFSRSCRREASSLGGSKWQEQVSWVWSCWLGVEQFVHFNANVGTVFYDVLILILKRRERLLPFFWRPLSFLSPQELRLLSLLALASTLYALPLIVPPVYSPSPSQRLSFPPINYTVFRLCLRVSRDLTYCCTPRTPLHRILEVYWFPSCCPNPVPAESPSQRGLQSRAEWEALVSELFSYLLQQ